MVDQIVLLFDFTFVPRYILSISVINCVSSSVKLSKLLFGGFQLFGKILNLSSGLDGIFIEKTITL